MRGASELSDTELGGERRSAQRQLKVLPKGDPRRGPLEDKVKAVESEQGVRHEKDMNDPKFVGDKINSMQYHADRGTLTAGGMQQLAQLKNRQKTMRGAPKRDDSLRETIRNMVEEALTLTQRGSADDPNLPAMPKAPKATKVAPRLPKPDSKNVTALKGDPLKNKLGGFQVPDPENKIPEFDVLKKQKAAVKADDESIVRNRAAIRAADPPGGMEPDVDPIAVGVDVATGGLAGVGATLAKSGLKAALAPAKRAVAKIGGGRLVGATNPIGDYAARKGKVAPIARASWAPSAQTLREELIRDIVLEVMKSVRIINKHK
jgi:hypothetical protein